MFGWEYCTVDISAVAFGDLSQMLSALGCQGWEMSPLQPAGAPTRLCLGLRRAVNRRARMRGWLWIAG